MAGGFEIFNKKQEKPAVGPAPESAPAGAVAWFGPPDIEQRFRYGVLKEEGDVVSVQPGVVKFKKGLTCLRWSAPEGGESTLYVVMKTTPARVDLKKVAKK
jgi:hypothetical protein